MKTSDYTIEDLVQGAELENNTNNKVEIQGNIGRVYLTVNEFGCVYLWTIEELKEEGYQLIKPIKMNGEFEVKKYEKPYPIVELSHENEDKECGTYSDGDYEIYDTELEQIVY